MLITKMIYEIFYGHLIPPTGMLLIILEVALLLGAIVLPLIPKKKKIEPEPKFRIDRDTKNAEYAISENGSLERLHHEV